VSAPAPAEQATPSARSQAKATKPAPVSDLVVLPDQQFQQLLDQSWNPAAAMQVNPFAQQQWQHNLGMTTQVLPTVAGAQSFNAQQLTQTVPEFYMSTHRQ